MIVDWRAAALLPDATLLEALQVIDRCGIQFALVVDDLRLLGTVTDGDIRRALMRGIQTGAPIRQAMNPSPVLGTLDEGPSGWHRKMRVHGIRHLPLVDAAGKMQRLITEQSSGHFRASWVVIMAGGLGTRLRPLTESVPKPMLEVGGRPILETTVNLLAHSGFRQLFLSVNYRAEAIERHFGDGAAFGVEIEYLREPKSLGTAGALSMLPSLPQAPILMMNADILTGLDPGAFIDAHVQHGALATVGVREFVTQIPYGVVRIEGANVQSIDEKPELRHSVSAGIYALSPELLVYVSQGEPLDMPTLLTRVIGKGHAVRAHRIEEFWIDVGKLDDLERARLEFQSGTRE
jgi:dTDP-glucose pyrophosphorylase